MKKLFFLLILLNTDPLFGQQQKLLSPKELDNDFTIFKQVLLTAHPNPYRFKSQLEFEELFDSYRTLLSDSLSRLSFFQIISSITSNINEAHSNVSIPKELEEEIAIKGKILPLIIHFKEGKAFIAGDASNNTQSLLKNEILSINGRTISSIINQMDSISCLTSGYNKSHLYRKLSLLQNFSLAYYLFIEQTETFNIQIVNNNGSQQLIMLDAIPTDFAPTFPLELEESLPPLILTIDTTNSLATIRITTFAHWAVDYKIKKYLKFYEKAFEAIEELNIQHLVIDVRNNRGGLEYLGAQLLTYLIPYPFDLEKSMFTKEVKYELLDSLGINYSMIGSRKFIPIDSGFLVKKSISLEVQQPAKEHSFEGDVYFLVDGNCFSACNIFMALADYHNVGKIIGEETGGIYQDTDGYFRVNLTLPNSGVTVNFPLWHIKTAVENEVYGCGVVPDIAIQPTVEELISGNDPLMDKVYELILADQQ